MRRSLGHGAIGAGAGALKALACVLLAVAVGCGDDGGSAKPVRDAAQDESDSGPLDASTPGKVSFKKDVQPIFTLHCAICHHKGGIIGVDLTDVFDPEHGLIDHPNSYAAAHGSKFATLVKPGSPDDSFLIYKVSADPDPAKFDTTTNGDPMPFQTPRLSDSELDAVKQWITDGAKNDASFTDKVAPIFGTQITLGGKRGKCTWCHYPDSPTGLNILDVFNADTGLVGADSISSTKKRVAPGSPDDSFLVEKLESAMPKGGAAMPLNYPRLTAEEVDTLRAWIELGAKND